jgi:hypothetical protein
VLFIAVFDITGGQAHLYEAAKTSHREQNSDEYQRLEEQGRSDDRCERHHSDPSHHADRSQCEGDVNDHGGGRRGENDHGSTPENAGDQHLHAKPQERVQSHDPRYVLFLGHDAPQPVETGSRFNKKSNSASDLARQAQGARRQTARGREETLALARSSISHRHHSLPGVGRIEESKFIFRPGRRRNRGTRDFAGISWIAFALPERGRYGPLAPAIQNAPSSNGNAGMIGSAWLPRAGRCDSYAKVPS